MFIGAIVLQCVQSAFDQMRVHAKRSALGSGIRRDLCHHRRDGRRERREQRDAATIIEELVAPATTSPGKMFYGTATSGSKLCTEMFKVMAGVNIAMVNYKSTAQALTDLMGGQLQLVCEPVGTSIAAVNACKLRALAVTSTVRLAAAPNVPTVAEAGFPGFEYSAWVGVFAPAGTPRGAVDKRSAEIAAVLRQPETVAKIESVGFDPMIGGRIATTTGFELPIHSSPVVGSDKNSMSLMPCFYSSNAASLRLRIAMPEIVRSPVVAIAMQSTDLPRAPRSPPAPLPTYRTRCESSPRPWG